MNSDDLDFAYKVRHALNEKLDQLPATTVDRLASSRKKALSRKKSGDALVVARRAFAGMSGVLLSNRPLWAGLGTAIPLVALVAGLAGIYQFDEQQRIAETAELDAAVLADELPLNAYVDKGFNAYLDERKN
ncbi:MAG: DNA-directed polymerase specialized sigma subunit [Ramlibacter sp.]|jgi:hypothetical protein|nr:DNA-directed polymerase specialized sigma subunit [Ramlibacter sp.]